MKPFVHHGLSIGIWSPWDWKDRAHLLKICEQRCKSWSVVVELIPFANEIGEINACKRLISWFSVSWWPCAEWKIVEYDCSLLLGRDTWCTLGMKLEVCDSGSLSFARSIKNNMCHQPLAYASALDQPRTRKVALNLMHWRVVGWYPEA